MKRTIYIIFCLLGCCLSYSHAQESCYSDTRSKGISLYNQKKYNEAINVFEAAKDCPDKPVPNDLDKQIRKCREAIAEAKKYLKVNDLSSTQNVNYPEGGGNKRFTVSTSASSYETYGVPSWCSVSNRTASSFILTCNENQSTSSRSDYMEVRADGRIVRINIHQSGKRQVTPAPSSGSTESAKIDSIRVEHNQNIDGENGITIHFKVEIKNMKGVQCRVVAYFYDSNYKALKDLNGVYKTKDGEVSSGKNFIPSYDNSTFSNLEISIPYKELHNAQKGEQLKFFICVWNKGVSPSKEIAKSGWQTFTYPSSNYLLVDGNMYEKTLSFDSSNNQKSFTVSTSADTYEIWGVPSWCSIKEKTNTSFTLICNENATSEARSDYIKVKADGLEVKINIRQNAGKKFEMTGTLRTSYTDNAIVLTYIVDKIKEYGQCRTGSITERSGIIVHKDNVCSYSSIPVAFEQKLKEITREPIRISDVCLTDNGWWCVTWDRNKYWAYAPQTFLDRMKEYSDNNEKFQSVSINNNGDWVVVTDQHFWASNNDHHTFILEAKKKYGFVYSVSITNMGIVVCCEDGIAYKNIPSKVLERMKNLNGHPRVVKFTDSGTCIVTDEKDHYSYYL